MGDPLQPPRSPWDKKKGRAERPYQGHPELDAVSQGAVDETEVPDRVQITGLMGKFCACSR